MTDLKAPFPYFGGKRKVAGMIWERLGDVSNFIEPFCGSAAVLLSRPHEPQIETVNDLDCMVANFWRATSADPEAVAAHADHPVNEADLHARHRWLVLSEDAAEFRRRMRTDPHFFDAKVAGWWCWGACCWIGSGWCSAQAAESDQPPRSPQQNGSCSGGNWGGVLKGPSEQLPKLAGGGKKTATTSYGGSHVHADRIPDLADGKRPLLGMPNDEGQRGTSGRGVHAPGPSDAHRPQLADAFSRGRGVHGNDSAGTCEQRRAWLVDWFSRLRDRLRTVRVCCGHWLRVCDSPSVTTRLGLTGVFLDPPYAKTRADGTANRSAELYANDRAQDVDALVAEVRAWCLERGGDPLMRICLAGYEGEGHEALETAGWRVVAWKAAGGYGNRTEAGKANAARERLWFSPHCLDPEVERMPLFAGVDD